MVIEPWIMALTRLRLDLRWLELLGDDRSAARAPDRGGPVGPWLHVPRSPEPAARTYDRADVRDLPRNHRATDDVKGY